MTKNNKEELVPEPKERAFTPAIVKTSVPWILTASGKRINLDGQDNEYDIEDIATSLSNIARYNGHTRKFYCVAQHLELCSRQAPKEIALETFAHDFAEYIIGDIARPVKKALRGTGVDQLEDTLLESIYKQFHLTWPIPEAVWEIDNRMLVTEAAILMGGFNAKDWGMENIKPFPGDIRVWTPEVARDRFLNRWYELLEHRKQTKRVA